MMYEHEARERRPNTHPMCTELPAQSIYQADMDYYLQTRKLSVDLARANGWYESDDAGDTRVRVVIPAVTHKPGHVYWQARDITGDAYIRYQSPKGPRHEAIVQVTPSSCQLGIVVVEGPFCALGAAQAGYIGFALMGMNPSKATLYHLILLMEDYKGLDTLVLLDRGEVANAVKISTFLSSQGHLAKVAELPEKDLAACLPAKRNQFLKQSFQSLFQQKSSVQQRKTGKRA